METIDPKHPNWDKMMKELDIKYPSTVHHINVTAETDDGVFGYFVTYWNQLANKENRK